MPRRSPAAFTPPTPATPCPARVPQTSKGWEQAIEAGEQLRGMLESDGSHAKVFCFTSPYLRCKQTTEGIMQAFAPNQLVGVQEEVLLREQDFGNCE